MFRSIHKGETCLIIGNGPSLDRTPLKELSERYVTFGANAIYRKPFYPDYYCLADRAGLEISLPLPGDFNPVRFMRAEARDDLNNPIYPITSVGFSTDIENFVVIGGTVTYVMLQIAFYMGFTTFLLVGVDHYYPNTPKKGFIGKKHDQDHFICADGKPYFEEGKSHAGPELDAVLAYYETAKEICDKTGRKIVNLTPGTKENVFEKDTFDKWLTEY